MSDSAEGLAGSHLAKPEEEPTPTESILKVVQKMFLKSFAWFGIYFLGYYNFSVAWLVTPLFLTALRSQWKKERDAKLSAAREAALSNEKAVIESRIRVEDLPSWVFFPDKERAEWINSIIQQLWPNVGHYTRKLISESIEPAVKSALEGYGLNGFKFERVVLGQIPPRITGIKVYDKNVSRNEIIMDMDLVFASDCDIKFSIGKIKAKIMDFSLRGLLRVVFKPIVNEIPLIGGVQAYFLTSPDIDFDLGGIANAFDAPGLSNIIRKIVLEQIGYFMVLPHKFTMPLIANVENRLLKCPDSAGVLRVRLHRATNLVKKDVGVLGMGKSDPYAVLSVGARVVRTKKINNTVNPEWDFVADFPIEVVKGQQLTLEILDHDDPGEDEFLGRATVQTSVVAAKGQISDMWVELEDIASGRALMSLSWLETTTDKSYLDRPVSKADQADKLTRCLLHVFIDCSNDLVVNKNSAIKPSPKVELRVGGQTQHTFPQYYNHDPVYEQGFVFLVVSPEADDLHIKILDTAHKDKVIGYTVLRMSDILKNPDMELANQPFPLQGSSVGSTITLAAQIRCLMDPKIRTVPSRSASPEIPGNNTTEDMIKAEPEQESSAPEMSKAAVKKPDLLSVDEMVANTIKPVVESAAENKSEMESLLQPLNEVRRRGAASSACGKIKMSLSYDQDKENLKVVVHSASGLPGANLPDPPDPYVKLYLLPEKSKKSKRKTEVVKDTTEPSYEESFDYDISAGKLGSVSLEVSVVDRKGIFAKSPLMGRAIIELDDPELMSGLAGKWFDLHEDQDDSD